MSLGRFGQFLGLVVSAQEGELFHPWVVSAVSHFSQISIGVGIPLNKPHLCSFFLRDIRFTCPRIPFKLIVAITCCTNLTAHLSKLYLKNYTMVGELTEQPYSRVVRTNPLYTASFTSWGQQYKFCHRKPSVLLALVKIFLTCVPSKIEGQIICQRTNNMSFDKMRIAVEQQIEAIRIP